MVIIQLVNYCDDHMTCTLTQVNAHNQGLARELKRPSDRFMIHTVKLSVTCGILDWG